MRSVDRARTSLPRTILLLGSIAIAVPACTGDASAPMDDARSSSTITAVAAYTAVMHGDTELIDIREPNEIRQGAPDRAASHITYRLDRSRDARFVDEIVHETGGRRSASITLICATGVRSAAARDLLLQHGFTNVKSLDGGFRAWRAARLPDALQAADSASERKS
jgi:rhodanese-related sulfurtransferase